MVPTLGYPSRTAAVVALLDQGQSFAEIAAAIGIDVHTVYALNSSARRKKQDLRLKLSKAAAQGLDAAAGQRGLSAPALAKLLLERIAGHDLYRAVLADEGAGGAPPEACGQRAGDARRAAARAVEARADEGGAARRAGPSAAAPARSAPPPSGARVRAPAPVPFAQRRAILAAAIAHLKARCILVDVVDRAALIRTYRVSGKREAMLAEEVIGLAERHGFDGGSDA